MKKVLEYLGTMLIVICTLFMWFDFSIFTVNNFYMKIILTLLAVMIIITDCVIIFLTKSESEADEKRENDTNPFIEIMRLLYQLDCEDDIKELRRIRRRVNFIISNSETNKQMIKASKDICGKQCKCIEIKNAKMCDDCKMYDAYVEYLTEHAEN